jgi:nucleoside 2-deoxyribosyltransferase
MAQRALRVYLAAPLFSDAERRFNVELCAALEIQAHVFLPQRDGLLLRDLIRSGVPTLEARRLIFDVDVSAIRESDVLVAVLDGRTIDEGVAFEIGVAYALQKRCLGLKTDDRMLLPSGDNPMVLGACEQICGSIDELARAIAYVASNTMSA